MAEASVKSTPGPTTGTTTAVQVDVLAGHLGHLTDEQQKALATFQARITEAGLFRPPGKVTDGGATHDETTLL